MSNLGLKFRLPIGLKVNGDYSREVELLPSNSVAEEVFTKKLSQEPFTYIANIISVAVGSIGNQEIADTVRKGYLSSGRVNIPPIVKQITMADANTLLLEIHRRVWEHEVKDMDTTCRFCSKDILIDVDLNKIEMPEKFQEILEGDPEFDAIVSDLQPFKLDNLIKASQNDEVRSLEGTEFNRIIFRIPTLGDAIKNEEYFDRTIDLWRRMGADCIQAVQQVTIDGDHVEVVRQLPDNFIRLIGIKIFKELMADNLKKIRHDLREELPVLPFAYMDKCPCDMNKKIPHMLDSSGFFSE